MAIVQISKIQHRSGNLVDLPQLDEAEFGFASDAKRVFIGKTQSGLENIEVLTSYSEISFSQIDGAIGNLNITAPVGNGEVLSFDGTDWVNKGGNAGGYINLGDISNLSIGGGSIGYVLETDGLGNLAWTSKGTTTAFIENISLANPGVVTTTEDNFLTNGAAVTITNCPGMTDINGGTYYANVLTSDTFSLYTDQILSTPLDTSSFNAFSYTSVTATTAATNTITVGDSSLFALNIPVRFLGDVTGTELDNISTFYIKSKPSGTTITVSNELYANGVAGNVFPVNNVTGLSANVYGTTGRLVSPLGGTGGGNGAAGSNTSVQYNYNNVLTGDGDFTWDFSASKTLTVNGNANVGNLNGTGSVTASRLISNVATGTTPLVVNSTTRVANLNVAYSNVADHSVVGNLTTGNYFPALVSSSGTGNKALNVSGSYVFDTANAKFVAGNVTATYAITGSTLTGGITTNAQPNITSVGTLAGLEVAGDITPDANVTYNLGNNTYRFNDLYLSGSTIYLGAQQITSNLTTTTFSGNISANVIAGNIQSTGSATMSSVTVTGNLSAGNISTSGILAVTGNANVGNLGATGVVATTVSGTLTTNAQPNITSVGTLTSLGVTGSVTGGNLITSGNANVGTLKVSGTSDLGAVGNVTITGGTANYILKTDGAGNLSWTNPDGGYFLHTQVSASNVWTVNHNLNRRYVGVEAIDANGISYTGRYDYPTIDYVDANTLTMTWTTSLAGYAAITGGGTNINSVTVGNSTPGGVNTQVQFNDAGALAGNNGLVFDKTTGTLTVTAISGNGSALTSITGANVTGAVSYATTANSVAGGNVSGAVAYATTANSVAGGNVSGAVAYATTANSVAGANVSGVVANATYATSAGSATSATTAGTVTTAAQPNITSVGTLTSLGVTGAVTAGNVYANSGTVRATTLRGTALTTGANTTAGTVTGNWTLTAGSRLQATYADLAEYYEGDKIYEPGTVLEFGGEKEVTLAGEETFKLAGVVSTNPAYVMNSECQGNKVAIALQGRCPVKVKGPVSKGDMMVSAGNGYAKATIIAPKIGTVLGKSLENFTGDEGVIEIAVGRL